MEPKNSIIKGLHNISVIYWSSFNLHHKRKNLMTYLFMVKLD